MSSLNYIKFLVLGRVLPIVRDKEVALPWHEFLFSHLPIQIYVTLWQLNPLTTTRNYSYTHFCRFLAVIEYSAIGVKFPPTIAWRILYTVKKKFLKIFNTFFVFKVLKHLSIFWQKLIFWSYFEDMWVFIGFFYCRNLIWSYFVTT